uniref:Uncharacterized protein n=2 Tax=Timema TaxID=61471 RepID=A0A7R9IA09_9NEOP|nr:unnamed protein product [Timema tahoe]
MVSGARTRKEGDCFHSDQTWSGPAVFRKVVGGPLLRGVKIIWPHRAPRFVGMGVLRAWIGYKEEKKMLSRQRSVVSSPFRRTCASSDGRVSDSPGFEPHVQLKINNEMFSFHKPKVYRSPTGCCICRAKSSSSRFTDSKKYEDDFMECFQLHERRSGEICNACVLLVKRWKKLPVGSERNWRHVVDARAGPGTKSLTKFKSKNKKKLKLKNDNSQKVKNKHTYMKGEQSTREPSPGALSDDITGRSHILRNRLLRRLDTERVQRAPNDRPTEDFMYDTSGMRSIPSSLAPSPTPSDDFGALPPMKKKRNKSPSPRRCDKISKHRISQIPTAKDGEIEVKILVGEKVCCGTIFRGRYGEVLVDPRFLKPCQGCAVSKQVNKGPFSPPAVPLNPLPSPSGLDAVPEVTGTNGSTLIKSYSDASSDSGYDESSNPGLGEASHTTVIRRSNGCEVIVPSSPLKEFPTHGVSRSQQERKKKRRVSAFRSDQRMILPLSANRAAGYKSYLRRTCKKLCYMFSPFPPDEFFKRRQRCKVYGRTVNSDAVSNFQQYAHEQCDMRLLQVALSDGWNWNFTGTMFSLSPKQVVFDTRTGYGSEHPGGGWVELRWKPGQVQTRDRRLVGDKTNKPGTRTSIFSLSVKESLAELISPKVSRGSDVNLFNLRVLPGGALKASQLFHATTRKKKDNTGWPTEKYPASYIQQAPHSELEEWYATDT